MGQNKRVEPGALHCCCNFAFSRGRGRKSQIAQNELESYYNVQQHTYTLRVNQSNNSSAKNKQTSTSAAKFSSAKTPTNPSLVDLSFNF